MNIKKIYYQIKKESLLPVAMLYYLYKDNNNIIQIGKYIVVDFNEDEKSIKQMEKIAKTDGFMFFVNSNKGKKWLKENPIKVNVKKMNSFFSLN